MSQSQVLVPVDGSPASLRAVDFAIEMVAQNPSTSLVLLNVQNIPAIELAAAASEAIATDRLQDVALQASAKALKDAKGQCENASVAFKTLVRTGQPAETIAQVARDEHVKHIVMGTRGLGRIQGLLLGSVAMTGYPFGRGSNHADKVDGLSRKRAIIAQVGLGANVPEDAIYPLNLGGETGKPLDGNNKYLDCRLC